MRRALSFSASVVLAIAGSIAACSSDPAVDDGSSSSGGEGDAATDTSTGQDVATSSDGAPIFVDGGPPGIQFIGRFDTRDNAGPKCGWVGCRILARFDGTSVSVKLSEIVETWMDGAPSEWDVAIDDTWQAKLVTTPGTKTYPLASGLPAGPHKVELYKRSEAQNGVTQFLELDFGGGTLLSPPLRSTRRVEIIGDSAAAGFGVEGVGYAMNDCPGLDYSAQWQNYRKSFGAVLGGLVSAEVHGTVFSGKGMVKNVFRPDTDPMPVLFPLANPIDFSSVYDFAWQPDAVILMIGGNDFAEGQPDESNGGEPATPEAFTAAYRTFVETLRTKYPAAHLFLSVSPSVSDAEPAGRNSRTNILNATSLVATERAGAGDTKVYTFNPTIAPKEELTGCNGHGTPAFHDRVAAEYATILKQKTGW